MFVEESIRRCTRTSRHLRFCHCSNLYETVSRRYEHTHVHVGLYSRGLPTKRALYGILFCCLKSNRIHMEQFDHSWQMWDRKMYEPWGLSQKKRNILLSAKKSLSLVINGYQLVYVRICEQFFSIAINVVFVWKKNAAGGNHSGVSGSPKSLKEKQVSV